jgi:hypothetical protein
VELLKTKARNDERIFMGIDLTLEQRAYLATYYGVAPDDEVVAISPGGIPVVKSPGCKYISICWPLRQGPTQALPGTWRHQ